MYDKEEDREGYVFIYDEFLIGSQPPPQGAGGRGGDGEQGGGLGCTKTSMYIHLDIHIHYINLYIIVLYSTVFQATPNPWG